MSFEPYKMPRWQLAKLNKHILIHEWWRIKQNWKIINGKWGG